MDEKRIAAIFKAFCDENRIRWIYQCAESACPVFWKSPVRKEEIMVSDR